MMEQSDLIIITVYVVLSVLIVLYCRIFKIKPVETVCGHVLFTCVYWIFCFGDAFMR